MADLSGSCAALSETKTSSLLRMAVSCGDATGSGAGEQGKRTDWSEAGREGAGEGFSRELQTEVSSVCSAALLT